MENGYVCEKYASLPACRIGKLIVGETPNRPTEREARREARSRLDG